MTDNSGPAWWYAFLRVRDVPNIRVWVALGCRESGADPRCLYPAGAPWGDWVNGNGRKFDVGTLQVNVVHLDSLRAIYGPTTDMRVMLDPQKNLDYAQRLAKTGFSDWGLKVAPDGNSYRFDWSSYPDDWVAAYAADSEAGFAKWWDAFPKYAAAYKPPAPKPVPPKKPAKPTPAVPQVQLNEIQFGRFNESIRIVQQALNTVTKAGLTVDGKFGPLTQAAYDRFRRNYLGWQGPDATGPVGRGSLTALGSRAHFKVVGL